MICKCESLEQFDSELRYMRELLSRKACMHFFIFVLPVGVVMLSTQLMIFSPNDTLLYQKPWSDFEMLIIASPAIRSRF